MLREESDMQEGSAIRDNENWVQTFGAYRSQRYRHAAFRYRETDGALGNADLATRFIREAYATAEGGKIGDRAAF